MENFQFDVDLLGGPLTIPEYRQTYTPRPELRSTGIFVSAYATGASGARYHGQRAFDDVEVGKSHTYSFCKLRDGDTTGRPPELWERPSAGQREPYEYRSDDGEVGFDSEHCHVAIREGGWTWEDGDGRWSLEVTNLGDRGYHFFVPVQDGVKVAQYHRSEMGRCRGRIEGEEVRGFCYLDYSWGPRDIEFQFFELPLIRSMNKAWMAWHADFEDGSHITGAARKGRDGVNWSMAYVVDDGVARVHTPTTTDLEYSRPGIVSRAVLHTGKEDIELVQDCSTYYPLHTIGRVASVSGRPAVTDSWVNIEWMPDNSADMLQAWAEGRVSGAAMAAMHVEGERMVIPGVIE